MAVSVVRISANLPLELTRVAQLCLVPYFLKVQQYLGWFSHGRREGRRTSTTVIPHQDRDGCFFIKHEVKLGPT
jgi:hypothetical protein